MSEARRPDIVDLYRVENPDHPALAKSVGKVTHPELVGEWFSSDLDWALTFMRKSTQTTGRDPRVIDGAQLVVAHVPADQLPRLHVSQHPIASGMDVEPENNFMLTRDGSFPMEIIPLDETLGDLRGRLGNMDVLEQARDRVYALIGHTALK